MSEALRKSTQPLLPQLKPDQAAGSYDIYPSYRIDDNQIFPGLDELAGLISGNNLVVIDGFAGVFYSHFREELNRKLDRFHKKIKWINTADYLKPEYEINEMISPFLGGDDPVFGRLTTLKLSDFFDVENLSGNTRHSGYDITIIIGPGAFFAGADAFLIYLDLPKNELQYRARAGSVTNLGAASAFDPGKMYKRFFFVDWVVLNDHKKQILKDIDIIVDCQNLESYTWIPGEIFRKSLREISLNCFRVRPWFEPGVWGGRWIKDHIKGLNPEVPNYAWSFELIVPENGLILESSGHLLEFSFDFLMYAHAENILGHSYRKYGYHFPLRFDFLDTVDGGNLSIQCHPRPEYVRENFGEPFTQEETYYILDCKEEASVYLGFRENIDPEKFENALIESHKTSKPVNIEDFIMKHDAARHDLFLIPYGTVHGSGKDNLVLEISTTPYIYTFKLYDWVRPDLSGKPRPLSIARGMQNLYFDRKGNYVTDKLISKPVLIKREQDWEMYRLPTHETHSYEVHRYHFKTKVNIPTENKCHVLSLVEGTSVIVTTGSISRRFNYAETFVIPAAAREYMIVNESESVAIVVDAFAK